jgi:hypothetical protein
VPGHAVVLLSVPFLCDAIREQRHKRIDDSEILTIPLPECTAEAVRAALRFAYSGVYEAPAGVLPALALLQCAATLQMVPLLRACAVRAGGAGREVWEGCVCGGGAAEWVCEC